jgi:WD40 repeat protein
MRNLKVGIGDIRLLAYRPDGQALIALDADSPTNRARVFPLPDGAGRRSVDLSNSTMIAISPDGRRIAHISFGVLKIWDADTEVQPAYRPWPEANHLSGIAFAADGSQLLITGNSSLENRVLRRLMAWDLSAADMAWHLAGVNGTQVACSPDGLIAVAGQAGLIERDDRPGVTFVRDGRVVDRRRFPRDVARVRFSADGTRLALARGPTVHVWDPATGHEVCRLAGHRRPVRDVAFSPDGRRLATAAEDEKVTFWDAATGRPEASFAWRVGVIGAVAFSPDGLTCAAGGSSGRVVVWDVDG